MRQIFGFLFLAWTASAASVFWIADPVAPNQTLLLWGDELAGARVSGIRLTDSVPSQPAASAAAVRASNWRPLVSQANPECIKVEIPKDWQAGTFAIRVETASGSRKTVIANRAETWWVMGSNGAAAAPGSEAGVFGKNLRLNAETGPWSGKVVLRDRLGKFHQTSASKVNKYSLSVRIPKEAATGTASIFVHNGFGGEFGWSAPVSIEISKPEPWPSKVYNVREFGAVGDSLQDDTAAIQAVLERCRENGGGVAFLPRGVYRITGQLTMPPRTILRGEKRETVWLFVPHKTPEFNTVLAGSGEFGVEDLSMVAQTPLRMITAPDVPSMYTEYKPWGHPGTGRADDVFLKRLRIHHLRYAHRVGDVAKDPRRAEQAGPSTVALAGARIEVSDCEIVSPGMPLIVHGTKHSRILRNELHTGRNGWYGMWGARETVFEGNTIQGQDLEASYGGFANYGNGSGTDVSRLYIAHNRYLNGFGGEREALTFDTTGDYPWIGRVARADASSVGVEGTSWMENKFIGLAALVIRGKGLGQHRRIVSNQASGFTIDVPWDVVPDATSAVAIRPYRRDVVVYNNYSQDASAGVQLWAGGYNFIIDGNSTKRSGGLWGTAAEYHGAATSRLAHVFLPCYFTQWLNNEISEGFIYQQGPEAANSATLGLYSRDAATGSNAGVLMLGNLIRGNKLSDNSRLGLLYYSPNQRAVARKVAAQGPALRRDTIIEDNSVIDSPIGIELDAGYEDTLVRNNHFVRVGQPILKRQWSDEPVVKK